VTSDSPDDLADRLVTTWGRAGPGGFPALAARRRRHPRDRRRAVASNKGLIGGFEVAGSFAYSEPRTRTDFLSADHRTARRALAEITPPLRDGDAGR